MQTYSHSKLSTFEQCPLKFKFRYIDYLEPDFKETIEGFLGNKVHETLEWIYNQPNRNELNLDIVIQHFIENWNKNFNPQIKITKKELTTETYFNKGIKFLINYFLKNQPFKDNTIATEKKISLALDPLKNYHLTGYIDRLVHNPETNIFEIHDYKTSGTLKSQEELDKDRQLALYSLAIRQEFENIHDIHLIWHFLDFNQTLTSKRTSEQLQKLKQEIIELINKIELTNDFPPNPGCLCNWCEYQSKCPEAQKFNNYNDFNNKCRTFNPKNDG